MSKKIACPHDRLFHSAMVDIRVAKEFLEQYLHPMIISQLDFDSLRLCSSLYVNKNLKLTQSDILYEVKLAGKSAYFLMICCEHQSKPDPMMPLRLLEYNVGIWNNHVKQFKTTTLPLIHNLVFYNGRIPYPYTTNLKEMFLAPPELVNAIFGQPFTLISMREISDETIRKYQWSGVLSFFMKNIFMRDFIPYLKEAMHWLKSIEQNQGGEYVTTLLNYALHTGQIKEISNFVETVTEGLSPSIGENIMTGAQRLMEMGIQQGMKQGMEKGIEKGMEKGIEKGIEKGKQTLLRQIIENEFGTVPLKYLPYIEAIDEDKILHVLKNLKNVKSLEEIFEF